MHAADSQIEERCALFFVEIVTVGHTRGLCLSDRLRQLLLIRLFQQTAIGCDQGFSGYRANLIAQSDDAVGVLPG